MDYTEKDLNKKLKTELMGIAAGMEGYNASKHKKKDELIAFILKKDLTRKPTKKEELIEKASKYNDFKKSVHGTTIVKLKAFLAEKEKAPATTTTNVSVVAEKTMTSLSGMNVNELRKIAKTLGWNKRTGTKAELTAFIKEKRAVVEEKRLDVIIPTADKAGVLEEVEMEEWPIHPDVLKKHAKTVDDLKKLLKAKGISVGLPRTKKEILELFEKSRCSFKNFVCSDEEFCDLRNNLCRELNILRNKDKEITKFAKGLVYIDEEKGRFYGTPDAIARVREFFTEKTVVVPVAVPDTTPIAEETKEEVIVQKEKEEGISPININRLLDKPSESDIRRAILHCLGLYHDIDPNDEIVM